MRSGRSAVSARRGGRPGATDQLTGPLLFARSRGLLAAATLLVTHVVVVTWCPRSPVPIPLRFGEGADLLPLALALAPTLVGWACDSPDPALERRVGLLCRARAAWWAILWGSFVGVGVLGIMLGAAPGSPGGGPDAAAVALLLAARNVCLALGLSTLAVVTIGRDTSWAPGIVYLGAAAVYGTDTYTG